jgi:hypothetical protein
MIPMLVGSILGSGSSGAATNYYSIATASPVSVSTITFSSIPATYTHLQLRLLSRNATSASNYLAIRVNGDSTSGNYPRHYLGGNGSSAYAGASVPDSTWAWTSADNSLAANIFGVSVVDLLDYANTNKYKTMRALDGFDANGSGQVQLDSGLWQSTAAINSITIYTFGPNFATGSQFALYGVK